MFNGSCLGGLLELVEATTGFSSASSCGSSGRASSRDLWLESTRTCTYTMPLMYRPPTRPRKNCQFRRRLTKPDFATDSPLPLLEVVLEVGVEGELKEDTNSAGRTMRSSCNYEDYPSMC